MTKVIEQMKQTGIPVELMMRLYHREILNNMYDELNDESKVIEYGIELNKIEITGPNNSEQMKFIFMKAIVFNSSINYSIQV